jgi:hypothetical protein
MYRSVMSEFFAEGGRRRTRRIGLRVLVPAPRRVRRHRRRSEQRPPRASIRL